jgi:hypothetical protein
MKVFIVVIIAATLLGGFIGGELTDQTFTIWGAAVGGVGTFAVLMGLGAYFSHQEEKREKTADLTPEMKAVFDRILGRESATTPKPQVARPKYPPQDLFSIETAVQGLIDQDLETLRAGKIPERRLIPHHAINRDVIIKAFEADFSKLSASMQNLNREHFESQIDAI